MHRSWLLVVVLGCGDSQQAQTTVVNTTSADPHSCAHVADHLIDLMSADAKDAPPAAIKHVHDVVLKHCDHDQWSAEARQCFVDVTDRKGGERCNDMLSAAQRSAIEQDMTAGRDVKGAPAEAPPTLEPAGTTRAPKPKKGGDPCEGGE